MLRAMLRWRLGERRPNPNSCCFCCHVRLGTVLIGVFSLVSLCAYNTIPTIRSWLGYGVTKHRTGRNDPTDAVYDQIKYGELGLGTEKPAKMLRFL